MINYFSDFKEDVDYKFLGYSKAKNGISKLFSINSYRFAKYLVSKYHAKWSIGTNRRPDIIEHYLAMDNALILVLTKTNEAYCLKITGEDEEYDYVVFNRNEEEVPYDECLGDDVITGQDRADLHDEALGLKEPSVARTSSKMLHRSYIDPEITDMSDNEISSFFDESKTMKGRSSLFESVYNTHLKKLLNESADETLSLDPGLVAIVAESSEIIWSDGRTAVGITDSTYNRDHASNVDPREQAVYTEFRLYNGEPDGIISQTPSENYTSDIEFLKENGYDVNLYIGDEN